MVGYNPKDRLTPNQKIIAGCMSGIMTRFITQPLDVIKVRTQLTKKGPEKRRFFRVSTKILKEEGYRAFFHGHILGQCHSVISFGSQFYVYEVLTKYFTEKSIITNKVIMHSVAGSVAGTVSSVIVSPIEVVRVRQMVHKEQYKGFFHGARLIYKTAGIRGFYEGVSAAVLQVGPAVGISFAVFTYVQPRVMRFLKHYIPSTTTAQNLTVASFVAGSAAGFISKTFTYPFDLAKRRLQIGSHISDKATAPSTSRKLIRCRNLKDCLVQTWKYEGMRGLYRGWKITVYKACLTSVVLYTTYEHMCEIVRRMPMQ